MNVSDFVAKWRPVTMTERATAQSHFLDLCRLVDHATPVEADPKGEWFTFERGVTKSSGKRGWADVWKRGHFAFEYKGKHKDLNAAYAQLQQYRSALENPPLLIACDIERIVIHTNFTGMVDREFVIPLDDLARPENLDRLRWVFHDPEKLKPTETRDAITRKVAGDLGKIAQRMRDRKLHPRAVARFLNRLVFCMFAEDVGLLPADLFSKIVGASGQDPRKLSEFLGQLFAAMAKGGTFGLDAIRHFNGNLFDDAAVILPTPEEMALIKEAARLDWSQVDPSIFGTLFERAMDPDKRSQLGAHYTSRDDIETLIEPVVMEPLRREWAAVRAEVERAPEASKAGSPKRGKKAKGSKAPDALIRDFLQRLQSVTILDPACGSGNFLYVALQKLKDLEQEVLVYSEDRGFGKPIPFVNPRQVMGLEVNPYAFDLAQMTIWIGYLQWQRANGYRTFNEPILQRLDTFRCMDSILDLADPENPREPEWPAAEFIVGNPPFLGNKRMRGELGEGYVSALWKLYGDRIPAMSDLCCYWFEKARAEIEAGRCSAAGLLATTGIKQVGARRVLDRIDQTGRIFFAVSDRDWILDGASVRICMVGFSKEPRPWGTLDGREVPRINPDLSSGIDLSSKQRLAANIGRCFMGTTKVGDFDIEQPQAVKMLSDPNPHGRPNSDVLRPFRNGSDLVRNCSNRWIIDFGVSTPENAASLYGKPFDHLVYSVKTFRSNNGRRMYRERWWIHGESRPGFRQAVQSLDRYIGTARVAKHRIFVWLDKVILPDSKVIAIASSDDVSFGVLHSRAHEVWTLANCGWHGLGNDATYNPTTCFETFPFPEPTEAQRSAIADAARELDALRTRWLNPPEWTRTEILEFPGSVDGPWSRFVQDPDDRGIGTVRYPVIKPGSSTIVQDLAARTLTNLYNKPPEWLRSAHRKLDEAVAAAYGWEPTLTDDEILARLLALNLERAGAGGPVPPALEIED